MGDQVKGRLALEHNVHSLKARISSKSSEISFKFSIQEKKKSFAVNKQSKTWYRNVSRPIFKKIYRVFPRVSYYAHYFQNRGSNGRRYEIIGHDLVTSA